MNRIKLSLVASIAIIGCRDASNYGKRVAFNFAYELSSDTLRDSKEQAIQDAPTTFGNYEIRKVERRVNNLGSHSNPVLTRTPKNKWIARCVNCGLGSNGAKSTIQFALDSVNSQFKKYPNCNTEEYVDLGKV